MKPSFLGPHNGERVRYLFRQNADHQPPGHDTDHSFPCGRPHREVPLERVTGLESKIMSTEPIPAPTAPRADDLLLPFEQQNFPTEYKEYYGLKRNNFFATIHKFRDQWNYYLMLDQIWMQEFRSLTPATDPNTIFPITVYMNAHLKVRVAIELAFGGTLPEARSIMRDAVEYAAHAHHMLKDPPLQELWLNKLDDQKAWEQEFWYNKPTQLFEGLPLLHEVWKQLSNMGSHANIVSMCERFHTIEVDGQTQFNVAYTGLDKKTWAIGLFDLLLHDFMVEEMLFKDYRTRLQFDEKLLKMRAKFEVYKEQLRGSIAARYSITPPAGPTIVHP